MQNHLKIHQVLNSQIQLKKERRLVLNNDIYTFNYYMFNGLNTQRNPQTINFKVSECKITFKNMQKCTQV